MFRGAVLTPSIRMFSVSLWSLKAVTDDLLELDWFLQKLMASGKAWLVSSPITGRPSNEWSC